MWGPNCSTYSPSHSKRLCTWTTKDLSAGGWLPAGCSFPISCWRYWAEMLSLLLFLPFVTSYTLSYMLDVGWSSTTPCDSLPESKLRSGRLMGPNKLLATKLDLKNNGYSFFPFPLSTLDPPCLCAGGLPSEMTQTFIHKWPEPLVTTLSSGRACCPCPFTITISQASRSIRLHRLGSTCTPPGSPYVIAAMPSTDSQNKSLLPMH